MCAGNSQIPDIAQGEILEQCLDKNTMNKDDEKKSLCSSLLLCKCPVGIQCNMELFHKHSSCTAQLLQLIYDEHFWLCRVAAQMLELEMTSVELAREPAREEERQ